MGGTPPDLEDLPAGDPATYDLLMAGDTLGVFQLESEGMRKLLTRIIPTIEEVLAAGGVDPPSAPPESVPPAIPNPEGIGDLGHRTQG